MNPNQAINPALCKTGWWWLRMTHCTWSTLCRKSWIHFFEDSGFVWANDNLKNLQLQSPAPKKNFVLLWGVNINYITLCNGKSTWWLSINIKMNCLTGHWEWSKHSNKNNNCPKKCQIGDFVETKMAVSFSQESNVKDKLYVRLWSQICIISMTNLKRKWSTLKIGS